jgi:ATP synthase protein I
MPENTSTAQRALGLTSVAFVMAAAIGLGTGLGWYLDKRWHTSPWLTFVGLLMGTVAGFVQMFNMLKQLDD